MEIKDMYDVSDTLVEISGDLEGFSNVLCSMAESNKSIEKEIGFFIRAIDTMSEKIKKSISVLNKL